MAGVAGRGPGAIALAPLATSPRRGDRPGLAPSCLPPHGTTELEEKRPLALFCCVVFFFFLNH